MIPHALMALFAVAVGIGPTIQQSPSLKAFTGDWVVSGQHSSADFNSPALGPEIRVAVDGKTIALDYSFRRHWTLKLDGTELRKDFQLADGPRYQEVAVARVRGDAIVVVTSRDRVGVKSREERVLRLSGDSLIVEGKRWVDGEVIHTSRLTYHRAKQGLEGPLFSTHQPQFSVLFNKDANMLQSGNYPAEVFSDHPESPRNLKASQA